MTFDDVMVNRRKWVEFLKQPHLRKEKWSLASPNHEENFRRCCIGHACVAFGFEFDFEETLNQDVTKAVGLRDDEGAGYRISRNHFSTSHELEFDGNKHPGLTHINDSTGASPQEIGEYLESVINGGHKTPFMDREEWEAAQ